MPETTASTTQAERVGPTLEATIPGLVLDRYDDRYAPWGSIPVQIDGTLNGQTLYFRFRGDCAYLSVWPQDAPVDEECQLPVGEPFLTASAMDVTGDEYAGWLTDERLVSLFGELVTALAPVDEDTNRTYQMNMSDAITQMLEQITAEP